MTLKTACATIKGFEVLRRARSTSKRAVASARTGCATRRGTGSTSASAGRNGRRVMAQQDSHRHHYTPKWLLKRFCGEEALLWWRCQDWSLEKAERKAPKGQFFKDNLNTRFLADGSKDVRVEDDLARVDNKIAVITKRLVEQCRQGHPPDLCEESRAFLYEYMYVQLKRSPELWDGSGVSHNERVDAVLQSDPEVRRTLDTKGLCLFSAPDDSPLIVGSQVVLRASAGRAGCLEDPDQGLAFPLAKDVLLGFIHGSSRREHEVLSASEVDSVNRATAGCCRKIGGPNKLVVLRAAAAAAG